MNKTKYEFIDEAMSQLGEIKDPLDVECVFNCLTQCFEDGFTLADAVRFTRLTEHVDPTIDEETACRLMAKIAKPYRHPKPQS